MRHRGHSRRREWDRRQPPPGVFARPSLCVCLRPPLINAPVMLDERPPTGPHFNLPSSLKTVSKHSHVLRSRGVGIQHTNLGDTTEPRTSTQSPAEVPVNSQHQLQPVRDERQRLQPHTLRTDTSCSTPHRTHEHETCVLPTQSWVPGAGSSTGVTGICGGRGHAASHLIFTPMATRSTVRTARRARCPAAAW